MSEANDPPLLDYGKPGARKRKYRWIWFIVLILFVPAVISFFSSGLTLQRRAANRFKCAQNLRQIDQAILAYASDHHGQYPDSFGTLLLNEDITSNVFVCPGSKDTPADGATQQAIVSNLYAGDHLSYIYLGNGITTTTVRPNFVLSLEPPSNHDVPGVTVLFGDGHVEFITPSAAAPIISQVKAQTFPVIVPAR